MFIGHYAVGFAAKRIAPQTSLGVLIAAVSLLDLLWPVLILTRIEEVSIEPGITRFTPLNFISYPVSHGLIAVIGWATMFAAIYYVLSRYWRGTLVIWLCVVSHWLLDFATHRRDMQIYAGGPRYGLGLWNYPRATVIVEGLMFLAGVWIYFRSTRALDRTGEWGFWSFVLGLAGLYVANVLSPPPTSVKGMVWVAIGLVVLGIAWAWWFDRHRTVVKG